MARLVRGDERPFLLRVSDRLREPDLLRQPCALDVSPRELRAAVSDGPYQRLVEDVLDHRRRVTQGHPRKFLAQLLAVHLAGVGPALQEVVDEIAPSRLGGKVEVERAIEAP